jgi:hypothetical protein
MTRLQALGKESFEWRVTEVNASQAPEAAWHSWCLVVEEKVVGSEDCLDVIGCSQLLATQQGKAPHPQGCQLVTCE